MSNPSPTLYNWSAIDWTKTNSEIIFETGASTSAVSSARKRYAPDTQVTRDRKSVV